MWELSGLVMGETDMFAVNFVHFKWALHWFSWFEYLWCSVLCFFFKKFSHIVCCGERESYSISSSLLSSVSTFYLQMTRVYQLYICIPWSLDHKCYIKATRLLCSLQKKKTRWFWCFESLYLVWYLQVLWFRTSWIEYSGSFIVGG